MQNTTEMLDTLSSCSRLEDLLAEDNKHTKEVGFILESDGTVRQFKTGKSNQIGFFGVQSDENPVCVVHTHPTIDDGPTLSEADLEVCEWGETVCGVVALSQDMFTTTWDGVCAHINASDGVVDKEQQRFTVVCDGTTNGPASERWIANPEINRSKPC